MHAPSRASRALHDMKELMLRYWANARSSGGLGERELAQKWRNSFGADELILTRVQANKDNPMRGGIPNDNLAGAETGNRWDKED
jgi:hypothetical protein